MKRFYQDARAEEGAEGWTIRLDGKPVRTPARVILTIASGELAEAIAQEWSQQGARIAPAAMPLTQLAISAADLGEEDRKRIIDHLAGYAASDLLCYREPQAGPLRAAQATEWEKQLAEAETRYAVSFQRAEGIMPVAQPSQTLAHLRAVIAAQRPEQLVALNLLTGAFGSLLLGLAVLGGRITGEQAFTLSRLESRMQEATWGEDADAAAADRRVEADVLAVERFIQLSIED